MTRPIYEPNLERADAALGYDKAQLQRRPAPIAGEAAEPGHLAMAYMLYDNQTITSSATGWTHLTEASPVPDPDVTEWYTNPAAEVVLANQVNNFQHLQPVVVTTGAGQKWVIRQASGTAASDPERNGVYTVSAWIFWDTITPFAGKIGVGLNLPSTFEAFGETAIDLRDASQLDIDLGPGQRIDPVTIFASGSSGAQINVMAFQDSGGDLDIIAAGLMVQQIGWWSASEGTFGP